MSDPTELVHHATVETQPSSKAAARTAGELAAAVFACFDEAIPAAQVVVRLAISPERVEALWRAWAKFRGHVLLFPETLASLADALPGPTSRTATAIAEASAVLGAGSPRMCRRCGETWAQFCYSCPREAAQEAIRIKGRAKRRPGLSTPPR